ncbi:MAG: endonuclease III [Planctomycetota bacterium]
MARRQATSVDAAASAADGPGAGRTRSAVRTPGNSRSLRDIPFLLPQVTDAEKRRARRLTKALEEHYGDAVCELDYTRPHELLVATILSAQATDVGVNKATPGLFAAFPTPRDYADATPKEIEPHIRTIGLFRNKAKAVHAAMTRLVEEFDGEVPQTVEELLTLRGVARKTANVVLGNCFGIMDGFVVDTHVQRLAVRLGLVEEDETVTMIERRLMALFPRAKWCDLSHQLIWHGRRACTARGRKCQEHPICRTFGVACERSGR